MTQDTIFALSSGAVPAGVAVIRLSGPKARTVMNKLIDKEPKPRFAALRYLSDPDSGDIIDQALVILSRHQVFYRRRGCRVSSPWRAGSGQGHARNPWAL